MIRDTCASAPPPLLYTLPFFPPLPFYLLMTRGTTGNDAEIWSWCRDRGCCPRASTTTHTCVHNYTHSHTHTHTPTRKLVEIVAVTTGHRCDLMVYFFFRKCYRHGSRCILEVGSGVSMVLLNDGGVI